MRADETNLPKKTTTRRERAPDPTASPKPAPAVLGASHLADAVREAERAKVAAGTDGTDRPRPNRLTMDRTRAVPARHAPVAAALALAAGLGWAGGWTMRPPAAAPVAEMPAAALVLDWGEAAPLAIRQHQVEAGRLSGELRAVTAGLTALRAGLDGVKQDQAARVSDLAQRLTRLERAEQEQSARVAQGLDQIAKADRSGDAAARLAQALERLDRIERTVTTASLPAPVPQTAALAPPPAAANLAEGKIAAKPVEKPDAPRDEVIAGWYLRGVHRGVALIEGRRGVIEVRPGDQVPGIGRVQAVEKRGREWVVVTARGLIATETW